jgi:hypothetical protein
MIPDEVDVQGLGFAPEDIKRELALRYVAVDRWRDGQGIALAGFQGSGETQVNRMLESVLGLRPVPVRAIDLRLAKDSRRLHRGCARPGDLGRNRIALGPGRDGGIQLGLIADDAINDALAALEGLRALAVVPVGDLAIEPVDHQVLTIDRAHLGQLRRIHAVAPTDEQHHDQDHA